MIADRLGEGGGRGWVGFQGRDDIDPVERVQVVEVDDVVLDVLRPGDQVADEPRIAGNAQAQRVLDRAHGGQRMDRRANAAGSLGEDPGVPRVASLEDELQAPDCLLYTSPSPRD